MNIDEKIALLRAKLATRDPDDVEKPLFFTAEECRAVVAVIYALEAERTNMLMRERRIDLGVGPEFRPRDVDHEALAEGLKGETGAHSLPAYTRADAVLRARAETSTRRRRK